MNKNTKQLALGEITITISNVTELKLKLQFMQAGTTIKITIILIIHSTESWAEPKDPTSSTTPAPPPNDQSYLNNLYLNQQQYSTQSTEDPYKYYYSSTSTSTTTTTTTTPYPPYSYDNNNNNLNNNQQNDYNQYQNDYTSSTTAPSTTTRVSHMYRSKSRPTINPFYYGIDYYKSQKTTRLPIFKSFVITSTKSPYDFNNFENSYFSHASAHSSPSSSYRLMTSALPAPDQPSARSTATTTQPPPPTSTFAPLKTAKHSVFDLYLKRLASTTRSPYNFENFGQYNKQTTKNPNYSHNLFGANSYSLSQNVSSTS